jgi:RNA polymerase sigma-70 factor (ECF subfamily)
MKDREVIGRVLAGDVESFRILVERYEGPLFRLVRNLVPDRAECEDVAQEVFLTAYTRLRSYDPDRSAFSTWLLAIARNKCLNVLKKKKPLSARELPEQADPRTPDRAVVEEELHRRLDAGLAALPPEQKTAFVLAEIQGLHHDEIARIEGVPVGTVKSRVSRAREKLRSLLRLTAEQL